MDIEPLIVPLPAAAAERDAKLELRFASKGDKSFVEWQGMTVLDRSPTLFEVFEDAVRPPVGLTGKATLALDDPFYGTACLKTLPGEQATLGHLELPIREAPAMGEYRYICFAWRKKGGGRCAGFAFSRGADHAAKQARYTAGPGGETPADVRAIGISDEPPEAWALVTRDLYEDFGERARSLSLVCPDGDAAYLDHVYLARQRSDFDGIVAK